MTSAVVVQKHKGTRTGRHLGTGRAGKSLALPTEMLPPTATPSEDVSLITGDVHFFAASEPVKEVP